MRFFPIVIRGGILVALLWGLQFPIGGALKLGPVLDPFGGVWGTARNAREHSSMTLDREELEHPVQIEMDDRGVPHIFAESDHDATFALGYLMARDRLFQMDFIHRAATGQLSELLGESAIGTDLFFRRNGIADAVHRNSALLEERLPREFESVTAYGQGVDAYINSMSPTDYPLEYKILGAAPPQKFETSYTMALFAFMTYDLSFQSSDVQVESLRKALGEIDFQELYPEFGSFEKTIIRPEEAHWARASASGPNSSDIALQGTTRNQAALESTAIAPSQVAPSQVVLNSTQPFNPTPDLAEGFFDGKGSNNWAVGPGKSSTGMPILAGDMHLGLSLPAIWYEAHLVTPTANVYGVTFPSVPGIVEGITPTTAWAFTNTGSDQLDTYKLQLNEKKSAYLYDEEWRPLVTIQDTIHVKGKPDVIETRYATHMGPVLSDKNDHYAIQWVGHEFGNTFAAIWDMNRATDYPSFEEAIRNWDYPMQNILYAGSDGVIAIRSTGYMPVRAQGNAYGVQDGTTSSTAWIGRVPFEELPHAISPQRGYLTSTNQRPAADGYPYYLNQDWSSIYRSIRIDNLLSDKDKHTPEDIKSYQADVKAVQADLFLPLIAELDDLTPAGIRLRDELAGFDGEMSLASTQARLFAWFMDALDSMMWDEDAFKLGPKPKEIRILDLIRDENEHWFDRVSTPEVESRDEFLRAAVNAAGELWEKEEFSDKAWGEEHDLVIRHITRSEALKPLWKGPFPYPGYAETLSPARSNPVMWSASWRVVVDFSSSPPKAFGVYPGGQSGNPFSTNYDSHIAKYVDFDYYPLDLRDSPTN